MTTARGSAAVRIATLGYWLPKAAVYAALAAVAAACLSNAVRAAPGTDRQRPSRGEAVAKARGVIEGGRFQNKLPQPEPVQQVRGRERDLPDLSGPAEAAGYLVSIIAWTAIAVVAALLVWATVAAMSRWGVLSRLIRVAKAAPTVAASVVGPVPSEEAFSAADRKAAAGGYLDAVRMLFIDSARMVEEAAAVKLEKSLTNGEYLSILPGESGYLRVMSTIAGVIDVCFYGGRECTRDDWLRCRSAFESLRPAQGGGAE